MRKIFRIGLNILAWAIGAFILVMLGVYFYIKTYTDPYIYSDVMTIPHSQTAIILGAAILKDDGLSPVLKDRADSAIFLYKTGTIEKILVTGNNDSLSYNEVDPVRTYLMKNGIPANAIFLDHAGFDTYSSMYRAKAIFQVQSAIIVSQSFHLPRSVFIARSLGISAYGFNADHGHYLFKNYVRESFANVKAVLDLIFNRQPKYLGTTVPISGTGNM
jgi:SanA protein